MELPGRIALLLDTEAPGLRALLAAQLARRGARVLPASGLGPPVDFLFYLAGAAGDPRAALEPVLHAARAAATLRHAAVISRGRLSVCGAIVADALRYLAAERGIPLALLRFAPGSSRGPGLAATAARAASLGLGGLFECADPGVNVSHA